MTRLEKNKKNIKKILIRRAYAYNTSVKKINNIILNIGNINNSKLLHEYLIWEYKHGIPYGKNNFNMKA